MITYDLHCQHNHTFEGWFNSSDDFEQQNKKSQIACPLCGSNKVNKKLSAPGVITKRSAEKIPPLKKQKSVTQGEAKQALYKLSQYVQQNFEDVGKSFPDEARKIHYGEKEERGIFGQATKEEAKDLKEEGIPTMRIPGLPKFEQ